jgi:hypothetical protein
MGLDGVDEQPFEASYDLTGQQLLDNAETDSA